MPRPSGPAAEDAALRPERLFATLAQSRGLVAAVSGGADSTALMLLLAAWSERPPVLVVSVDHGLRPESADETRVVVAHAERLGLPAVAIRAPERPAGGNLQDWARQVRYEFLVDQAQQAGCDAIVTAHHRDDQAETMLLRLARGSGVYGLAAMAEESSLDGLRLVRPLLYVPKAALTALVAQSGLAVARDPSNFDPRFDRVRVRQIMPALAELGLDAARLSRTAAKMRRAANALDQYAQACLAENFRADAFGTVHGPIAAFTAVPDEIALRVLARICRAVGGARYTPRLDRLEGLLQALLDEDGAKWKRTLNGAVLERSGGILTAYRELGRGGLAALPMQSGSAIQWDRRFRVTAPGFGGEGLSIGALGASGRRLRSADAAGGILATLPGLYADGALRGVPVGVEAVDDGPSLDALSVVCLVPIHLGLQAIGPAQSP